MPIHEATPAKDAIHTAATGAPMLDEATERELLRRIRRDSDPVALQRLVESHLRLVLSIARRFARQGVANEDLVSEGCVGLLEAARRFDPDKGARFSTYASWWVRALIRRFALANRRIVGMPSTRNGRRVLARLRDTQRRLGATEADRPDRARIASELGVSVEDVAQVETALSGRDVPLMGARAAAFELASPDPSPEDQAEARERARRTRESMRRGLPLLTERERLIVERRLLCEDAETLKGLGRTLGISRERVRQIELTAKEKMRALMTELVA